MNMQQKPSVRATGRRLNTTEALVEAGLTAHTNKEALENVASRYAISVPQHLASLIDTSDNNDPIALQVLPSLEELTTTPEEHADPIGDHTHSPLKGLVHRYPDRVLLKVHSACAVYCRFCFRREMVGPGGEGMNTGDLTAAYSYLANHPEIWEVILTGGDPLVLSPARLRSILDELDAVDHVAVIRLHTRVPVAEPERITEDLVNVLRNRRATVYVAIHNNHPKELTDEALTACRHLSSAGIPLLGQTVLLKDVNDDANTLVALFRTMVKHRILPYYLHHPDLAPGTSHFRVPLSQGQALMKQLRGRLSGTAIPTYVLDIPGGHGKVPVGPAYVREMSDDTFDVEDVSGHRHTYPQVLP